MANHEINEEQEAVNKALRMIETSDPVHADVYNALFSILINNDVFLEKLANKMVQQVMISHVMDSTNPDMVMGADQGPVITKLIEKVQKQVDVLNTNAKKHRHIVAVETVTVNLSPQLSDPNINNGRLMAGKFIDLTENFPEHDSIVPVPFLVATGWFTGGVEIRALTKNSITVRLLNGTDKDSGGYASFKLLFFE